MAADGELYQIDVILNSRLFCQSSNNLNDEVALNLAQFPIGDELILFLKTLVMEIIPGLKQHF